MKKLVLGLLIFLFSSSQVLAGEFSLRPGSGQIREGTKFSVDIMIDSEEDEIILARTVLTYDPQLVKVIKAERNDSLFCTFPGDDQSVDNTNGVLMLTGFCQSGVGTPYKTAGDSDVFARIEFEALKQGNLVLEWEYSGSDEPFKSVMMKDGSPTLNILTSAPANGSYTIVDRITNPSPSIPETGYTVSIWMIVGGVVLVLLGFIYTRYFKQNPEERMKGKTVVVYE